ncbi:MAG: 50S ribosome-binding GTPase [Desulfurococcales archaeon]|nr:50S ribosome-binding GTPase [Desulfurococcales archaeon]
MPRERTEYVTWDPSRIAKRLHVPTYDEVLEKIKSRYPKRSRYKSRLDAELARLQLVYNIIISKTSFVRELVRVLDSLHPFFWDLIRIEFNEDEIHKAISCIAKTRRLAGRFWERYRYLLLGAESPRELERLSSEGRGRMLSQLKRCSRSLETLRSLVVFLSKVPAINPQEKTIIIAGAPSTGKSTFISTASRAKPRVSPFPFTTRSIHVGHTVVGDTRIQLIDTPGLLDRPPEEMNSIELKAAAALRRINGVILLLLDASPSPALELERQIGIIETLKRLGAVQKGLYIMINKTDIADPHAKSKARREAEDLVEAGLAKGYYEGTALSRADVEGVIRDIAAREGWLAA